MKNAKKTKRKQQPDANQAAKRVVDSIIARTEGTAQPTDGPQSLRGKRGSGQA